MQPVSHGSRSGGLQTEAGFSRLVAGAAHASRATGSDEKERTGAARLAGSESRAGGEEKRRREEQQQRRRTRRRWFDGVGIKILAATYSEYLVQHNWRSRRVTWPLVPPLVPDVSGGYR